MYRPPAQSVSSCCNTPTKSATRSERLKITDNKIRADGGVFTHRGRVAKWKQNCGWMTSQLQRLADFDLILRPFLSQIHQPRCFRNPTRKNIPQETKVVNELPFHLRSIPEQRGCSPIHKRAARRISMYKPKHAEALPVHGCQSCAPLAKQGAGRYPCNARCEEV